MTCTNNILCKYLKTVSPFALPWVSSLASQLTAFVTRLCAASLPGTNPMNLPRVKYLSSSWDRKAVSPRSGFSAISCVTLNCAQEIFTRNKTRCINSQLQLFAVSVSVTGDKIVIRVWELSSPICHASPLDAK